MTSLVKIGLTFAVVLLPFAANAQHLVSPGEVEQRFQNQDNRTTQGLKDGQLTAGQASRLQAADARKEAELQRMQTRDGAGGSVTARQDARLNRQLNHESRRIYAERHGN
jgi:hypothetical protein